MRQLIGVAAALLLATSAGAAVAQSAPQPDRPQLFGGVYAHDVNIGIAAGEVENGAQLQLGMRSRPLGVLAKLWSPRAYVYGQAGEGGDLKHAAAGLVWRFGLAAGGRLYLAPELGLAVNDGPNLRSPYAPGLTNAERQRRFRRGQTELDLGSRVTFEPGIGLGWQVSDRVAIEASYVHLSHAMLFSRQNPGVDELGARLVVGF